MHFDKGGLVAWRGLDRNTHCVMLDVIQLYILSFGYICEIMVDSGT